MSALACLLEIRSGADGTPSIWCPREVVSREGCRAAVQGGSPGCWPPGVLGATAAPWRAPVLARVGCPDTVRRSGGQRRQRVPGWLRRFGGQQRQGDLICLLQACLHDFSLWHTRVGARHRGAFWAHCLAGLLLPRAAGTKVGPDKLLIGSIIDLATDGLAELGVPQIQLCSCTVSGGSGAQLHQVSIGAQPGWRPLRRLRPPLKSWRWLLESREIPKNTNWRRECWCCAPCWQQTLGLKSSSVGRVLTLAVVPQRPHPRFSLGGEGELLPRL